MKETRSESLSFEAAKCLRYRAARTSVREGMIHPGVVELC